MGAHDWVDFKEGRARFSGGIRGWDEVGHQTFGVEMDGRELYGEVRTAFLPDGYNFNIEVVSFGYFSKDDVGMPRLGQSSTSLSSVAAKKARSLIVQLVTYTSELGKSEERPIVMLITDKAQFMGTVFFSNNWVFISDDQAIGESS